MVIINAPKLNSNASAHSRARYQEPSWKRATVTPAAVTPDTGQTNNNIDEENTVATSPAIPSATVEPLRATVGFERSISVRPYETAKASIFIQTEVDINDSAATMRSIRECAAQAKAAVFEELGIQFSVDEGGFVRELIGKHFGAVTEVTTSDDQFPTVDTPVAASAPASAPQAAGVSSTPPFAVDTKDAAEKRANKSWAKQSIAENPDDWYFNAPETKRNPRGPDYKHKTNGMGYWLD